ncbi:hypothetical protein, partial [Chryseobacterium kwangjuense]|uniref:hypothetical protein n=1 Tax=Chryseobacterium kwangjuense TaxID=267125 RepID=UPI000B1DF0AD
MKRTQPERNRKIKACILSFLFPLTFLYSQNTNLALGKPVTSSSIDNVTFPNSNLTDGNFSTFSRTGTSQTPPNAEWFLVDLQADYYIQNIRLGSVIPDNNRSRRFMIVTYPSSYAYFGNNPQNYTSGTAASSVYNRFIYSNNTASDPGFGRTAANPNIPGNPEQTLGPAFNNGIYNLNIGIHKARYILILNLQDTNLEFTELQVTSGSIPVRTFVNGGFEQGTTTTIYESVPEGTAPGWSTTEPISGDSPNTNRLINGQGGCIDFISFGYISVPPYEGAYYAELNSYLNSELVQQPICILPNETFSWSFAHRGRVGTDVMRMAVDNIDVAEFRDSNAQSGTHTGTILPGGTAANLTLNKDATTSTGWTRYHGTWQNTTGLSKQVMFSFKAVSAAGGVASGNFIDDVKISGLSTILTFDTLNPKGDEATTTANLPKILINGPLATSRTIQVTITGGTAVRGTDYTTIPATGPLSITIPAGNYDGTAATAISLASVLQVNQDFISEGDETIILKLEDPGTGDIRLADSNSC